MTSNTALQVCFYFFVTLSGTIRCESELRDVQTIYDLVVGSVNGSSCGCIAILRSRNEDTVQKSVVDRLARLLARKLLFDSEPLTPTVMTYTTENYKKLYMDAAVRKRDTCIFWATVVIVDNSTTQQLAYLSQSHLFEEQFWLLFSNRTDYAQLFDGVQLKLNNWLYVVQDEGNGTFAFNQIDMNGQTITKQMLWSKPTGLEIIGQNFYADMKGFTLTVGTLEAAPYLKVTRNESGKISSVTGFYGEIWNILSEILQFHSIYVEPADGIFGSYINGNWTGLYGMIIRKEVNILLSDMIISETRHHVVDFLHPIDKTKYKIFYHMNAQIFDWVKVFRPFQRYVWIALITWIIIGGIAIYIMIKAENKFKNQAKNTSLATCFYFILRALSNQGNEQTPKSWAQRIFFLTAYLLASVILPSYSAALISALTLKTPVEPFRQLTDIIWTDFQMSVVPNTTDYDYFAKSSDTIHQIIFENSVINDDETVNDYFTAIQSACVNHKTVFFGLLDEVTAEYRQQKMPCILIPLKSEISPAYKSIVIAKHSQYKTMLEEELLQMIEYGLINRFRRFYLPKGYEKSIGTDIGIGLVDVGGVFIYLLIFQVVSVGIFLLELVVWKYRVFSY